MITIRLLGGAKKAVGRSSVELDRQQSAVSDILSYLQGVSAEQGLLVPDNLIIAINGIDSAALEGPSTLVKSGDSVTVVTVVHGG
ncbi:MAG: MoaD/ThiS family protein [Nitrososphaera sp.]|jgi:molybdopterin converting factor small subunit